MNINGDIKVHFVGIGGIGMSGIADVLLAMGYLVSGSDMSNSFNLERLRKNGAEIYVGHESKNVKDVSVMVYSSAISDSNPEIKFAKEKNIPLMRRAEMLAELMKLKKGIAIAGTHGKTTTTSFLATILQESDYDPTYIIGGVVDNLEGNAKVGKGEFLVAEADESDGSFLLLNPCLSVITNIDNDHMNFYKSESSLIEAFLEFANRIPFYGVCALNIHDEKLMEIKAKMKKPYVTFGIETENGECADFEAREIRFSKNSSFYDLFIKGEYSTSIQIALPGEHNILNSLGAISIAYKMGVALDLIASSIKKFNGIGRRFQTIFENESMEIIDDYGHHPTEISTTIKTVQATRGSKKLNVIFEPHRYSRTKDCWNEFLHCFNESDSVFLCPIYPASEKEIPGINSKRLASDINNLHPDLVKTIELNEMSKILKNSLNEDVTFLVMGAGSIGRNIREIVDRDFK